MKKTVAAILFVLIYFSALNQTVSIIPQPAEIVKPEIAGSFTITAATQVIAEGSGMDNSISFLKDFLNQYYSLDLQSPGGSTSAANAIHLNFERMDYPIPGAYTLQVKKDGIYINGDNENGIFYGVQTLLQLLPAEKNNPLKIPYVNIKDYPRFQYRGLHLDVGRHFFPVDFVKRYIDYIAMHKMNYFHWHLTEDQGWRVEIKKYPKLTEIGAYRNGTIIGRYPGKGNDSIRHGGFYTQDEIKDVVAYAAKRYVIIIPEIEMPGHASAALAAYPYLGCTGGPYKVQETWGVFADVFCAGNDSVFTFLQDVLDEVIPLFPAKYIHVGGDECPKTSWKVCPKCQKRIKDNGLKDEHELQSYFIQRMEKYINSKGKTMIGWDEILEGGLAPNAVVMSWRGEQGGIDAAKQNHDVIMTPGAYVYFDHSQSMNEDSITIGGGKVSLQKTYNYEPIPQQLNAEQGKHILGAQGNVWTEYIGNTKKMEYTIFPRASALSEVLWSPKAKRNWADFEKRLRVQFKRYDLWGANYSKAYYDLKVSIEPITNLNGLSVQVESPDKSGEVKYETLNRHYPKKYIKPIIVTDTRTILVTYWKNNDLINHIHLDFSFNKATGKKINLTTPPKENMPGNGGAFGLINGAASEKGSNSNEWLGWQGNDMEAVIDLGKPQSISKINVHILTANGSQPCKPPYMEAYSSVNGKDFSLLGKTTEIKEDSLSMGNMMLSFPKSNTRYTKVFVKNFGIIPDGMRGAGNPAWLYVDEIQVE